MLRVAASRVAPLSLSLKEGPIIFRPGPTYYRGVGKRYYTGFDAKLLWNACYVQ